MSKQTPAPPPTPVTPATPCDPGVVDLPASASLDRLELGTPPTPTDVSQIMSACGRRNSAAINQRSRVVMMRWRATPQLQSAVVELKAQTEWAALCEKWWGEFAGCPGTYDE